MVTENVMRVTMVICAVLVCGWNVNTAFQQMAINAKLTGLEARRNELETNIGLDSLNVKERTKRAIINETDDSVVDASKTPVKIHAMHFTLEDQYYGSGSVLGRSTAKGLQIYDRQIQGWKAKEWDGTRHVGLEMDRETGKVIVNKSGTYLLYAQIQFHDRHNVVGFGIYINDDVVPVLESKQYPNPTHTHDNASPTNDYRRLNLFAVQHMRKHDEVFLKMIRTNMTIVSVDYLTFWGIAKLGTNTHLDGHVL